MYKIFDREIGLSFKMLFWMLYWELPEQGSGIRNIANIIYIANECYSILNDTPQDFKNANEVLKLINDFPNDDGFELVMHEFVKAHGGVVAMAGEDDKKK